MRALLFVSGVLDEGYAGGTHTKELLFCVGIVQQVDGRRPVVTLDSNVKTTVDYAYD